MRKFLLLLSILCLGAGLLCAGYFGHVFLNPEPNPPDSMETAMATAREAENNFNQVCPPDMTGRITAFPPDAITFQINQLGQQLKDAAGKPEEPSLKDRVEKFQKLQQFSQAYVDARRGAAFAEHKRSLWEYERRRAIIPTAISAGVTLLGLGLFFFGFPRKQKTVETKFPGI